MKVQFHWDRAGQARREQLLLGPRLAALGRQPASAASIIPRIGQEVIVDFLEGDPDRPIITGRVYNAPPCRPTALPANANPVAASRATRRRAAAARNELRFEDKKG